MKGRCSLKRGREGPVRWSQSPERRMSMKLGKTARTPLAPLLLLQKNLTRNSFEQITPHSRRPLPPVVWPVLPPAASFHPHTVRSGPRFHSVSSAALLRWLVSLFALCVRCAQHHRSFRETSRLIPSKAAVDSRCLTVRLEAGPFQTKARREKSLRSFSVLGDESQAHQTQPDARDTSARHVLAEEDQPDDHQQEGARRVPDHGNEADLPARSVGQQDRQF